MGIGKNGFKILLATTLCMILFSSTSRANNRDIPLREIFSKSQNEPGEAFYFFIPQITDDQNQYTYVCDTKLDRLLFFPKHKDLISKIDGQEMNPENWPGLLNEFILNIDPDVRQGKSEGSPRLKVIELNDDWVKFSLDGRHIVLPRELMAEEQGVHIRVFSAYRSYEKQRYLFLNAVSRYGDSQNGVAKPWHYRYYGDGRNLSNGDLYF